MKSDFLTNLFFRALQTVSIATMLVRLLLPVAIVAALYLLWRIARNLEKPPKLTEEVKIVRKSLSEMLKENRTRCKMTQEFVAESIGVSRQAVSKWENGASLPDIGKAGLGNAVPGHGFQPHGGGAHPQPALAVQGAVHHHFLLGLAVACHAQHLILVAFKVAVTPGAHRILQFLHSRSFLFCKKGCCAGRVQQPTNLIL